METNPENRGIIRHNRINGGLSGSGAQHTCNIQQLDSASHGKHYRTAKTSNVFKEQKNTYIMNPHIDEWKKIKKWYQSEHEQTSEIKFRIEAIESLLKSTENTEKELNHFK